MELYNQVRPSWLLMLAACFALLVTISVFSWFTVGIAIADTSSAIGPSSETTVKGAVFPVPESLEENIDQFRSRVPGNVDSNAFILATSEEIYVVFSETRPDKGVATVTGRTLERGISTSEFDFGVINADTVSVKTTGRQTTIGEVTRNAESYEYELVQIEATHRQISILNDPDQGQDTTVPLSAGVLVEEPITATDIFSQPELKARSLGINSSTEALGSGVEQEIDSLLGSDQPKLFTFDFETRYWSDTEETVDGIVLTPGSQAYEFARTLDKTGTVSSRSSVPFLYVVDTDRELQQYSSVTAITENAADGEVVSVEANLYGQTRSTQETVEETTPCGQSRAQIPAPSGAICIDILQDVAIDTGVAWTSPPDSENHLLFVAGLSSQHFDEPSRELRGRYEITGEVIATSRFDESLSEGHVLVIHNLERSGDLQLNSLSDGRRSIIQDRMNSIQRTIQNFEAENEPTPPSTSEGERSSGDGSQSSGGTPNIDSSLTDLAIWMAFTYVILPIAAAALFILLMEAGSRLRN